MPILNDIRKTKEIELPSYDDSKVVIYPSFLVGDLAEINIEDSSLANGIKTLVYLIKSWNFTDEGGSPTAITEGNIKKLSPVDIEFILTEIKGFADSEKKSLGN